MDNKELIKIAYSIGADLNSVGLVVLALQEGIEIGATEQKAIDHSEEHLNLIIKLHEEWSSMFNPNKTSFKEWVDKAMEEYD